MSVTLRELIYDYAGGIRGDRALKAVIPGGSSVPVILPDKLDTPASFDGLVAAGSMLGSAAIMVMDETTDMVWLTKNLIHFYKHESCGKCTPCREGTWWLVQILHRLEAGQGQEGDIEKLLDLCENILGRSFCALGDGATSPISSAIKFFRPEFEAGMHTPAWELFPYERSTTFVREPAGAQA